MPDRRKVTMISQPEIFTLWRSDTNDPKLAFPHSARCTRTEKNIAKMQVTYLYTVCWFVVISVILSYYYIGLVGNPDERLTDVDDISTNRNISLKMLQRVQNALEEQQGLRVEFEDWELMSRAIQVGNVTCLKNVLKKVLRGENITLLVIGGSNSAGGKLGLDENSLDGIYFKAFAKWWNSTFGKAIKSFVKEIRLTIGATGSPFFAFCYKTFIARGEKIDIVLIEISTNDCRFRTAKHLEQLTRQVLEYPSAPAVLYINLIGNLGYKDKPHNPTCRNLETFGQTELARHYEITSFSLKELFCSKNETGQWKLILTNMAGSDGNHIGLKAHSLVASLIIKHVRSVARELFNDIYNAADQLTGGNKSSTLPKFLLIKHESEALAKPLCWTGKTPNAFKNLHHPNLQLQVINNVGFSPCFQVRGEGLNVKRVSEELRIDSQGGWCASNDSRILRLRIYVPLIAADSFRESRSVIVLSKFSSAGQAEIWMDNNSDKAIKTDSNWRLDRYDTIRFGTDALHC